MPQPFALGGTAGIVIVRIRETGERINVPWTDHRESADDPRLRPPSAQASP
jgi:hypothetical protein